MSVDLPLPFGPEQAEPRAGAEHEADVVEHAPLAEALGDVLGDDEPLRAPVGRGEVDRRGAALLAVLHAASSSTSRAACWMRACDLVVRALGPWRSHSSSRRTRLPSVSCQCACSRSAASLRSRNSL